MQVEVRYEHFINTGSDNFTDAQNVMDYIIAEYDANKPDYGYYHIGIQLTCDKKFQVVLVADKDVREEFLTYELPTE